MSTSPLFLAFITTLIVFAFLLGANNIPVWRIFALFAIGIIGISSLAGVYSILGPGPASDVTGQIIRDASGHPLYRSNGVASAIGYMTATTYLSLGCMISALILGLMRLLSSAIRNRGVKTAQQGAAANP